MLHDKMTREELLTLALFDNDGNDVNIESLTVTQNGTYSSGDTAYSPVTVAIDDTDLYRDTTDSTYESVKTLSNCGAFPMLSLKVGIEPQQDLHGYDHPWVGGSGKNKCPVNELDNVGWAAENSDLLAFFNGLSNGTYNISFKSKIKTLTSTSNTWVTGFLCIAPSGNIDARITTTTPFDVGSIVSSNITFQITDTNRGTFTELYIYGVGDNQIGGVGTATMTEIQVEQGSAYTGYAPYSNICPISGWDEAVVTRCGKNLWGGEKLADDIVAKVPNATKDTTNKTVSYSAGYVDGKVLFDNFKPNTRYTIFMMTSSATNNIVVKYTDGTNEPISKGTITVTQANKSIECLIGVWLTETTVLKYEECGIFEGVITAQDFEPYNGQTYNIQFRDGDNPLTVYGGTLDVVSGELKVVPYYASYNGETLEGEWISDRDVYAVGTTPTIGAQVVNIGATPTTIQLTPTQVNSLLGTTNLWADTGDVGDVRYFKKVEL